MWFTPHNPTPMIPILTLSMYSLSLIAVKYVRRLQNRRTISAVGQQELGFALGSQHVVGCQRIDLTCLYDALYANPFVRAMAHRYDACAVRGNGGDSRRILEVGRICARRIDSERWAETQNL